MKTYFGQFQWQSDCPRPAFVTDEGAVIEDIDISHYPSFPPLEEHLSATLDENVLVEYRRDQSVAAVPSSTHSRVALAYVKTSFDDDDEAFIDKRAKQLQDNYNRATQGHRTMEAKGFLVPRPEDGYISLDDRRMWNAVKAVTGVEFTHFHILGGWHDRYCGIARMRGRYAITYSPWKCGEDTDFHEHGHNAGLHHSGKNGVEYGERDRIMGSGRARQWLNAPHLYHLGALDENHVEEFLQGETGHAYLAGFNTLEMAIPSGADRMIELRQSDKHRMISVSLDKDHLDIHTPYTDRSRSWSKTNHVATLQVGEVFTIAGRTIEFEEYNHGIASVVIDGEPTRKDWPEYPDVSGIGFDDCLGAWGNPHWGAQGLHILPGSSEDTLWVAWLTWDYSYNPIWYAGELTIGVDVAAGPLNHGGTEEPIATLIFTDEENGIFRVRIGDELFATPLKRVSRATSSTVVDKGDGSFITKEVAQNGVEFGYVLVPEKARMVGSVPANWEMHQDGIRYKVEGGMRGVKTDYQLNPIDTANEQLV